MERYSSNFPLRGCCQFTDAGLCRKFIHTLTVRGQEFPTKHGAPIMRSQMPAASVPPATSLMGQFYSKVWRRRNPRLLRGLVPRSPLEEARTLLAPYDLRRTCAKVCRKSGGDLGQIQMLLGHAPDADHREVPRHAAEFGGGGQRQAGDRRCERMAPDLTLRSRFATSIRALEAKPFRVFLHQPPQPDGR